MRPKVKHSGDKIVPRSDLRAGTALDKTSSSNTTSSLNVLQWNAGGLTASKRTELEQIININNIDVFCIMEANLTEELLTFSFKGYYFFLHPKARQIASGILIGVKEELTSNFKIVNEMNTTDKIEISQVDIWKNKEHYKLFCCYNPPNNSPNLSTIQIQPKTVIIGDFNAHSTTWGYRDQNEPGKVMEDFINTNTVELIFNKTDPPTFLYHSGSCTNPDLLIVSSDIADNTSRQVLEDPGSGHRAVMASITSKSKRDNLFETKRKSWNFKKAKWSEFTKYLDIKTELWEFSESIPTDEINREFCNIFQTAAKLYIPRGKVKRFKYFWNKKLSLLKKERNKARRKAEKTKLLSDTIDWRKKAAILVKEINSAKQSSFNSFVEKMDFRKDGLKAYSFISSIKRGQTKVKKPFLHNGRSISDDKKIASLFNTNYTSKYNIPKQYKKLERKIKRKIKLEKRQQTSLPESAKEIFTKNYSLTELNQAIAKLRNKSAPGPDNIHPEFLKHMGTKAKLKMLEFLNLVWRKTLPAAWKKAVIIPILKEGKPEESIESYRPISLTSQLAKMMERMLSSRLNWFLENFNILSQYQAGFRKHRSTNEQVIRLSQEIKDAFNRKEMSVAVFVDFKAAYDGIWRCKLLEKLSNIGVRNRMFKWISEFINQRFCATRYSNSQSIFKQTHAGLPQGAVLSTTLFNVYVNDLLSTLEKTGVKVAAFADDIVIWSSRKPNQQNQLSNDINRALRVLKNWCTENLMSVNEDKTKFQVFSLARTPIEIEIRYNGKNLERTDEAKYLGVTFDSKLTFNKHVEKTSEKATKKLRLLKRLSGTKWGSSRSTLNTTYNMYVKPTITYCSEVLITANKSNKKKIEKIQNEALRLVTGAVKSTPISAMYALTRNKPLIDTIEQQALSQYEKIIRLPNNTTWNNYSDQPSKLKTQSGFIQEVKKIKKRSKIPEQKENLLVAVNPTVSFEIDFSLHLEEDFRKQDIAPTVAKIMALETIHKRYPQENWLHIYTDGSLLNPADGAGAGIFCELFSFYKKLGRFTTNFDGEIAAIKIALQHTLYRTNQFENAVILSDSKAAIQAIVNNNEDPSEEIREIRRIIKQLYIQKKSLVLQWIPAHCDLAGNETADYLAKKGTKISSTSPQNIPYDSVKRLLRSTFKEKYDQWIKSEGEGKKWQPLVENPNIIPNLPRKAAVAHFRLLTGHDCLAQHLHKINIKDSPICPLCSLNAPMNSSHLNFCPALEASNDIVGKYWDARGKMA
ncbi:hypothetical protein M8J77_009716 [Diaphorina citri]|nr:hypothetical protein M8J77_009716 [Diaphorina citri]